MSLNSRQRRRRERAALRPISPDEMRSAIRSLQAAGLIETEDGKPLPDDPDQPFNLIVHSRERALERAKADPNVYKTPAGNLIAMKMPDGEFDHWMTPEEAEAWQVRADLIDAEYPEGTRA